MIRPPPRSTRTDTLFPYTTLFRSVCFTGNRQQLFFFRIRICEGAEPLGDAFPALSMAIIENMGRDLIPPQTVSPRSEERRVGEECVSTCRSRWSPYH